MAIAMAGEGPIEAGATVNGGHQQNAGKPTCRAVHDDMTRTVAAAAPILHD